MNEWNEMNNRDENGSGLSAYTQGTLSPAMYNLSIGVHLLVGLVITYFLALRMPYVFPQIYSVHPLIFSIGFLVVLIYPAQYIVLAAVLTTVVVITMTVAGMLFPNAFLSMGKTLFIALIGLVVAEFVTMLLGIFYPNICAIIGIFIFSLYLGYDWARGQKYPSTASYACFTALQLYMDIINIFIRILRLLASRRR